MEIQEVEELTKRQTNLRNIVNYGFEMPSFFNLDSRVVGFILRIEAAPLGPLTLQLVLSKTFRRY